MQPSATDGIQNGRHRAERQPETVTQRRGRVADQHRYQGQCQNTAGNHGALGEQRQQRDGEHHPGPLSRQGQTRQQRIGARRQQGDQGRYLSDRPALRRRRQPAPTAANQPEYQAGDHPDMQAGDRDQMTGAGTGEDIPLPLWNTLLIADGQGGQNPDIRAVGQQPGEVRGQALAETVQGITGSRLYQSGRRPIADLANGGNADAVQPLLLIETARISRTARAAQPYRKFPMVADL